MSWILQIDTAQENAFVSLSHKGRLIGEKSNFSQKDHASFLHTAVASLLQEAGIGLAELNAVATISGPGSYTGLRVGLASAKGFCYALNIPLITVGTLEYMASSALLQLKEIPNFGTMLVCPLIDARRMEVYTALYNSSMELELPPQALILDEHSLANWLVNFKICFFGTGCAKWRTICTSENAVFKTIDNNSWILSTIAYQRFQQNTFENLAYTEPFYLKEFYFNGT